MRLGQETRQAWVDSAPHRHAVDLMLEGDYRLSLAVGVPEGLETGATFRVLWKGEDGQTVEVLEKTLDPAAGGAWCPVRAAWTASGRGQLHFEATSESEESIAIWGSPVLSAVSRLNRPSVILVLLDTLRADHLGCYGYQAPTSPRLDALAETGVRFERVLAQAPWTLPATMSILTSRTPTAHGMISAERILDPSIETLASRFAAAGYRTAAITEGGMVDAQFGFDRGFELYLGDILGRSARETFEAAREWIDSVGDETFFLVVHTYEIHEPYEPPAEYLEVISPSESRGHVHPRLKDGFVAAELYRGALAAKSPSEFRLEEPLTPADLEHIVSLYDAEIRFTDACLGELVDHLKARGRYEDTLWAITSDHGEDFYDHFGFGIHAHSLFDELLHVPWILTGPGVVSGHVASTPVAQIDIAPTLLELVGLDIPAPFMGRSLVPLTRGMPLKAIPIASERSPDLSCVEAGSYKLIEATASYVEKVNKRKKTQTRVMSKTLGLDVTPYFQGLEGVPAETMLFDLEKDPGERRNIATSEPERIRDLTEALERLRRLSAEHAPQSNSTIRMRPELERRLRNLGYLGDDD